MYKTDLLILLLGLSTTFIMVPPAQAAGGCPPIYNGGQVCNTQGDITLDKTIQNPQDNSYTNDLLQKDYIFSRGETVNFHLTATNTTNSTQNNVTIVDTLPTNLDYATSDGNFDTNKRTVTFNISQIPAHESKTVSLQAVVNTQDLPNGQSTACITNPAVIQSTSFFFFTNTVSQNYATFCLQTAEKTNTPNQTAQVNQNSNSSGPQTIPPVSGQTNQNPTQTKGGNQVYTPQPTKTTPGTGPEAAGLLVLPLFAYLGRKLQKYAR